MKGNLKITTAGSSSVNEQVVEELAILLEFVDADNLRETVLHVYLNYITHCDITAPPNFEQMADNMFMLLEFLRKIKQDKDV